MSHIDSLYKSIPSFWKEYFNDKPILDSMLNCVMDRLSDYYSDCFKPIVSSGIHRDKFTSTYEWEPLICDISSSKYLELDANNSYQAIPVSTRITKLGPIFSMPNLKQALADLYYPQVELVLPGSDRSDSLAKLLDCELMFKSNKVLVLHNYAVSKSQPQDSLSFDNNSDLANIVHVSASSTSDPIISSVVSATEDTLATVSLLGKSYKVRIVAAYPTNKGTDIVLRNCDSLPYTSGITIAISGSTYKCVVVENQAPSSRIVLWSRKSKVDDNLLFNKFAFSNMSGNIDSSVSNSAIHYSYRELALLGPNLGSVKKCLAASNGSPLFKYGEDNGESLEYVDLVTNSVVSSDLYYKLPIGKHIRLDILRNSNNILVGGTKVQKSHLAYLTNDINLGYYLSNSIHEALDNGTAINSELSYSYGAYLLVNGTLEYDILYIARNYCILKSSSEVTSDTDVNTILLKRSSDDHVLLDIDLTLLQQYNPVVNRLLKLRSINATDEMIECPDVISGSKLSDNLLSTLHLPSSIYSTSLDRRVLNSQEYDLVVGEVPLHRVGDYNIDVGLGPYKVSAHYIYSDIVKFDSYAVITNSLDTESSFDVGFMDIIHSQYMPTGSVLITT